MRALFSIAGRVLEGKRVGRGLGFPTANLRYEGAVDYPPDGVYAAIVEIEGVSGRHRAVLNQGRHPTLPEGPNSIEIHLLDYAGTLYDRVLHVHYLCFLREERRFESPEALKKQLKRDVENAAKALKEI